MKFKKFLSLFLGVAALGTLAACNNNNSGSGTGGGGTGGGDEKPLAGTYSATIWVSETETKNDAGEVTDSVKKLTEEQIAKFNQTNTDGITINATVEKQGEGAAATNMLSDVATGADIFCFAQDQFARLVTGGALNRLGDTASKSVAAASDTGVVNAAKVGDMLYAYPLTADNGYFMYYDKSVVQEAHLGSLEDILADCVAANKFFAMELEGSAWYTASFFFATDSDGKRLCKSEWVMDDEGKFTGVNDDFKSANGLIAVQGMRKLVTSPNYLNSSKAYTFGAPSEENEGDDTSRSLNSAVVVSGTWDVKTAQQKLGNNFGVAELPSFEVGGKKYHLGSYNGCKLMGVKPQTDVKKGAALQKLALFLTGKECSEERYQRFGWGPANLEAQKATKDDLALNALFKQNVYSVAQPQIHGSWWDIAKVIATGVKNTKNVAAEDLNNALNDVLAAYDDKIKGLFTMSEEEKAKFTVIGAFEGHNWDFDVEMTKTENDGVQTWESSAITFAVGDAFKVRQGGGWDVAYPSANYVIETAGTYKVKLVYNPTTSTGEVTLVPAN